MGERCTPPSRHDVSETSTRIAPARRRAFTPNGGDYHDYLAVRVRPAIARSRDEGPKSQDDVETFVKAWIEKEKWGPQWLDIFLPFARDLLRWRQSIAP